MNVYYLVLILTNLNLINGASLFCNITNTNTDSSELPRFPNEFETKVVITSADSDGSSSDALIIYDSKRKKGELIVEEYGNVFRRVYYFDENEILIIKNGQTCTASKLTETNDPYFGFDYGVDGLVMQSAAQFFHFNNLVKLPQETKRGILVNHYQNCQNWTALNSNYRIDFYFKVPQFKPSIVDPVFTEILVEINIEGLIYNGKSETKFSRTYSFYEFRSSIQHRQDLYTHPAGVYCENQTFKLKVPSIPEEFSFSQEIVSKNDHKALFSRYFYSSKLMVTRTDLPSFDLNGIYDSSPVKIIHDYNSGVGYVINKDIGNCSYYPVNTDGFKANEIEVIESNSGSFLGLKSPNDFFGLKDTAFFAGQRYERGILCDVYVSNRTDLKYPDVKANYFVYEIYFLSKNLSVDFQSSDGSEYVVPISTRITAPGTDFALIDHIYDFDSKFHRRVFDVSKCFSGKNIKTFGIKYNYPKDINVTAFDLTYGSRLIEKFDKVMLESFKIFNVSPLRILEAKIDSNDREFTVYSGVHSFAPALNHFKKFGHPKIDVNKALRVLETNSASNCAKVCLNDSVYDVFNYKCLSFDYCKDKKKHVCSFYNQSLLTDQAIEVNNDSAITCNHYSKIVKNVDGADVDTLYRSVKQSVAKNLFNLEITDEKTITFSSIDIFDFNLDHQTNSDSGSSSFFQKFELYSEASDFNRANTTNKYIFLQKNGISIDECARFCLNELRFNCQTMSYSSVYFECKWSSLDRHDDTNITSYFLPAKNFKLFSRDILSTYIEYPFKVTTSIDYIVIDDVDSPNKCASKCNKETSFVCRSFNLCSNKKPNSFKCLLSQTNIHRNTNITTSTTCSHYSKNSIADFQYYPNLMLQINAKSIINGISVESCAEQCVFEDSYLCRSFDYNIDKNVCYLYTENLKDEIFMDLKKNQSLITNHYSRLYYEKNGTLITVQANGVPKTGDKFESGFIFGFVISTIIGCFVLGVLFGFVYLKLTKKPDLFPVMRFTNPNYNNQTEEIVTNIANLK